MVTGATEFSVRGGGVMVRIRVSRPLWENDQRSVSWLSVSRQAQRHFQSLESPSDDDTPLWCRDSSVKPEQHERQRLHGMTDHIHVGKQVPRPQTNQTTIDKMRARALHTACSEMDLLVANSWMYASREGRLVLKEKLERVSGSYEHRLI